MSNRLGAHCDWLTLSFLPFSDDGLIRDLKPVQLAKHIFKRLQAHGLVDIQFKQRSSEFRRYQYSYAIHRPVFDSEVKTVFVGILAYTSSSKHNQGLCLDLGSKGVSEEYGFNPRDFLNDLLQYKPRITRFDLAVDYPLGDINFDWMLEQYQAGSFYNRGAMPSYSVIQPRRRLDTNAEVKAGGNTVYIGKRGGSRHCRGYEKAYQLADSLSVESQGMPLPRWFRFEVELRTAGEATIPYDVLFDYDGILAGQYPNLTLPLPSQYLNPELIDTRSLSYPIKLLYQKPEHQVSIHHLTFHARRCYGGAIHVLKNHLDKTSDEIVSLLENDKIPKRLLLPITR